MATTQLNKAVQRVGSDAVTKMTFSAWIKRSALGEGIIFAAHQLSSYYTHFYFNSDDRIQIYSYINSSTAANLVLERRFRDTAAWYHIVLTIDTTLGTDSDRMKVYVNGVRETVVNGSTTYPSQNSGFGQFNDTGATLNIGNTANRAAFAGGMSHIHYTPYTAYDASAFGETDSTTGHWTIKTSPSLTYSTAGFNILKDGNSLTDQSGNSNNFTLGAGTLTNTEDCPSNVFATFNSLSKNEAGTVTFSNGNLKVAHSGTDSAYNSYSTIGLTSGKWYSEFKYEATSGGSDMMVGMSYDPEDKNRTGTIAGADTTGFGYWSSNGDIYTNGGHSSFGNSYAVGDIVGMATDLDNNKVYFSKNGVWQNSGDPTSGATGTGSAIDLTANQLYFLIVTHATTTTRTTTYSANFGDGVFGTTAVSSAGTNASGNGIFEYDVPTGYTALSTKGLNL